MIALLRVELRRVLSRRLVRVTGLLGLGGLVLAAVIAPGNDLTRSDIPGMVAGVTVPLAVAAWIVGASFVGADWHTGFLTTTLTWEPRRVRLFLAKATVVVAFCAAAFVAFQALLGLAVLPSTRVIPGPPDEGWFRLAVGYMGRGALLASMAAVFGFSIASVARNTAGALGLAFGYMVVIEGLLVGLVPGIHRWLLLPNAIHLVSGEDNVIVSGRTTVEAGLILLAYAATALVAATAWFRARDVT